MPYLSSLVFSTVLIIFNHIIFTNCLLFSGGPGYISLFTGNKLYYKGISDFFYVDLTEVSLDSDTVVQISKWIYLDNIKPKPDGLYGGPLLGGKDNDKIIFLEILSIDDYKANIFDTTLKQWEINKDVVGKPKGYVSSLASWVTNAKTGLAYSFDSVDDGIVIFDSVNLEFLNISVSNPQNLFNDEFFFYKDYAQVLLPSDQILYIGGRIGIEKQSMSNILTYDIIKDTWQMMVWKSLILLVFNIQYCIK